MRTTTEVRLQKQGDEESLQYLAAKMHNWDVTGLVNLPKPQVEELKKKVKAVTKEPVVVEVEINDRVVEQVIERLWGYAKQNYLQTVYGIPESFRFP